MAAHFRAAVDDLISHGEPMPPDLHERFFAWIRPATNARR
jgi:hypothetical protein